MILILIILNLFWSVAAFYVDFPKFTDIPFYLWLVVPICPIYPALFAVVWFLKLKELKINRFVLAFASLPSAVLGPLAVLFYTSQIYYNGFSINDFGQIFWVLFYSLQGWVFIIRRKLDHWPALVVCLYLLVKFWIDFRYNSFGYLQLEKLPESVRLLLVLFASALTLGLTLYSRRRKATF